MRFVFQYIYKNIATAVGVAAWWFFYFIVVVAAVVVILFSFLLFLFVFYWLKHEQTDWIIDSVARNKNDMSDYSEHTTLPTP